MKKFKFKINGSEYEVSVNEIEDNVAEIEVNGTPFTVEIQKQEKASATTLSRKPAGKVAPITSPKHTLVASAIKAPLPGNIMKVLVKQGQSVKRGDLLMTMESMKMENNIMAENDGIIRIVHVSPGQNVLQDDLLIDFEGTEEISEPEPVSAPEPVPSEKTVKTSNNPVRHKEPGITVVKSPLPGNVVKIAVKVNQSVKRGDLLMTLESMKMENNVLAEKNAVIKAIHVQPGQTVMQDDVLFDLE